MRTWSLVRCVPFVGVSLRPPSPHPSGRRFCRKHESKEMSSGHALALRMHAGQTRELRAQANNLQYLMGTEINWCATKLLLKLGTRVTRLLMCWVYLINLLRALNLHQAPAQAFFPRIWLQHSIPKCGGPTGRRQPIHRDSNRLSSPGHRVSVWITLIRLSSLGAETPSDSETNLINATSVTSTLCAVRPSLLTFNYSILLTVPSGCWFLGTVA